MSLKTCKQFLNITLKPKNSKCSKVKREYRVAAYKLAFNFIIRKSNLADVAARHVAPC